MAHAAEVFIFVARTSIEVDADASKRAGEGFSGYSKAIGKFCDLVEFDGVLQFRESEGTMGGSRGFCTIQHTYLSLRFLDGRVSPGRALSSPRKRFCRVNCSQC